MLKMLLESARPHSVPLGSLVASLGVHLALGVPAWDGVVRAREAVVRPESFITRALFVPPPDRRPAASGTSERIGWVRLPDHGVTDFVADAPLPERLPDDDRFGRDVMDALRDAIIPTAAAFVPADTAYSILEVDEQAVRSDASDAPLYPNDLLAQSLEGAVRMRYVVGSGGSIDTSTAVVLRSTHPRFTAAVLAALARMRFVPAKVNDRPVSQLVEQEFQFRIHRPVASADSASGAATPR